MNKEDLQHIIIMDDPNEPTTKKQLKAARKWFNKTFKKRLIGLPSRLHNDDEAGIMKSDL